MSFVFTSLLISLGKPSSINLRFVTMRLASNKQKLDYSKVPQLKEEELEETMIKGSGPGGQAVNKTSNCIMLRHKPTNIIVKCHIHRVTEQNRKEARNILINKLDQLLNGEESLESQKQKLQNKKTLEHSHRRRKLQEMKQKFREREKDLFDKE